MKPELKTITGWLETFDEPYRSQALENRTNKTDQLFNHPSLALISAFTWKTTKQGDRYWRKLYRSLGGKIT